MQERGPPPALRRRGNRIEAGKKENRLWLNWHVQNMYRNNRKYPDIKDGDMFRFKLKPSIGTEGHEPKWSSTRHKVVGKPIGHLYVFHSKYRCPVSSIKGLFKT